LAIATAAERDSELSRERKIERKICNDDVKVDGEGRGFDGGREVVG